MPKDMPTQRATADIGNGCTGRSNECDQRPIKCTRANTKRNNCATQENQRTPNDNIRNRHEQHGLNNSPQHTRKPPQTTTPTRTQTQWSKLNIHVERCNKKRLTRRRTKRRNYITNKTMQAIRRTHNILRTREETRTLL